MDIQELDKQKLETGPVTPEKKGEEPEISDQELDRILGLDQNIVAADKQKIESLEVEIPALLAEINAGALEQGESQRLLGEVSGAEESLEEIINKFIEQTAGRAEPLPAAEPEMATLDISGEAGELDAVEAEYFRAIAQEKEVQADVSPEVAATPQAIPEAAAEPDPKSSAADRLNQVREFLVAAEKVDKKKNTPEYAALLKEYQEARAEFVAGNVENFTAERARLAEERAEAIVEEKGHLQKFYDSYKGLGEYNLAKLFNIDERLEAQDGENKLMRAGKATGRFLTRTISLRTGLNVALAGAGIAVASIGGAGVAAGGALLWGRRILGGAVGGAASYDALQHGREKLETGTLKVGIGKWKKEVGKESAQRRELSPEEAGKLSLAEVNSRLAHFEAAGGRRNQQDFTQNETYILLQERFKELSVGNDLDALMAEADAKLLALGKQSKVKDRVLMAAGTAIGALITSGVAFKGLKAGYQGAGAMYDYLRGHSGASTVSAMEPESGMAGPVAAETDTTQAMAADSADIKLKGVVKVPGGVANVADYNAKFVDTLDQKPNIAPTADTLKPAVEIKPPAIAAADTVGKAPEVEVAPKGPEAALDAKAAPVESPSSKHFEYQGGKSVWNELAKQYEKRFPGFDKLPKGEQTYLIDQIKDKIVAHHGELGLADIDHVQASEMKAVDWDKAFADAKLESPHLSAAQMANIEDYKPPVAHEAVLEQPAAAKIPEDILNAQKFPEVEFKPAPEVSNAINPDVLAQQAQPEVEIAAQNLATTAAPETITPAVFEKTAQTLVAEKLHQNWTPEKLKTFMYLHEAEAARLAGKPDLLQSKLQEFNKLTQDLTERVKTGSLKDTGLTGAQAAHGAKGETFLLQQHGKDGWRIWQVKEGNQVQSIVEQKKGLFGLGKKNVDIFDSKGVKEILGYTAEPKGVPATAQELAQAKIKKAMVGQPRL